MTAEDAETTQENQQMEIEILHTRYAGEVYMTPVILVLGLFFFFFFSIRTLA